MRNPFVIFFFMLSCSLTAQVNRSMHWHFGWRAGLDFSSGQPVADTTGKLESIEGCATISDTAGNLLFYSNGETAWNRNNDTMPNGTGLMGNQSSEQAALIVPVPGNDSLYYLFASGGNSNMPLSYSIVNMHADNGLGDIGATKNVVLLQNGTEGLGGTMHCNGRDYWIVSREQVVDTLRFCAYMLSSAGLGNPVISDFPMYNPSWNLYGFLTFSQDGRVMGYSSFNNPLCLFHFDTQSGQLSLHDSIPRRPNQMPYSNAFSPDHSKWYISDWIAGGYCHVSQYDLNAPNIGASRIDIDSVSYLNGSPDGYGFVGTLQLGPDQKLYVSRWKQTPPAVDPNTFWTLDSLDAIQFPNMAGTACMYQRNAVYLHRKPTEHGLPNFISNFTAPAPGYTCPDAIATNNETLHVSVFPNPFIDQLTLYTGFPPGTLYSTDMIDVTGRIVRTIAPTDAQELTIGRGDLKSGLYLLRVRRDGKPVAVVRVGVL